MDQIAAVEIAAIQIDERKRFPWSTCYPVGINNATAAALSYDKVAVDALKAVKLDRLRETKVHWY